MEEQKFDPGKALPAARKGWEAPAIVLERTLEVAAQGSGPSNLGGFLGPLGVNAPGQAGCGS